MLQSWLNPKPLFYTILTILKKECGLLNNPCGQLSMVSGFHRKSGFPDVLRGFLIADHPASQMGLSRKPSSELWGYPPMAMVGAPWIDAIETFHNDSPYSSITTIVHGA